MEKKTLDIITRSGNHYLVQIKRNKKTLHRELTEIIREKLPLDIFEQQEKAHGRLSWWCCSVFSTIGNKKCKNWGDIRRLIHIKRVKYLCKKKKWVDSDALYVCDIEINDVFSKVAEDIGKSKIISIG